MAQSFDTSNLALEFEKLSLSIQSLEEVFGGKIPKRPKTDEISTLSSLAAQYDSSGLPFFTIKTPKPEYPVLITSIHAGSWVRPDVERGFHISPVERFQEEDPYTDMFLHQEPGVSVDVHRSRFETDLNRPPGLAVYRRPEDAWGLSIWKSDTAYVQTIVESMKQYLFFYRTITSLCESMRAQHQRILHIDVHSFNDRRKGYPDINYGTAAVSDRWNGAMKTFATTLENESGLSISADFPFSGGTFTSFISHFFGSHICCFQIEFNKRTFMNGNLLDFKKHSELKHCLSSAIDKTVHLHFTNNN